VLNSRVLAGIKLCALQSPTFHRLTVVNNNKKKSHEEHDFYDNNIHFYGFKYNLRL
jgi:hypothetical protein